MSASTRTTRLEMPGIKALRHGYWAFITLIIVTLVAMAAVGFNPTGTERSWHFDWNAAAQRMLIIALVLGLATWGTSFLDESKPKEGQHASKRLLFHRRLAGCAMLFGWCFVCWMLFIGVRMGVVTTVDVDWHMKWTALVLLPVCVIGYFIGRHDDKHPEQSDRWS